MGYVIAETKKGSYLIALQIIQIIITIMIQMSNAYAYSI
jgi:hypothetical protein